MIVTFFTIPNIKISYSYFTKGGIVNDSTKYFIFFDCEIDDNEIVINPIVNLKDSDFVETIFVINEFDERFKNYEKNLKKLIISVKNITDEFNIL